MQYSNLLWISLFNCQGTVVEVGDECRHSRYSGTLITTGHRLQCPQPTDLTTRPNPEEGEPQFPIMNWLYFMSYTYKVLQPAEVSNTFFSCMVLITFHYNVYMLLEGTHFEDPQ